jgi:alpha-glucosidase (family GH31 glycosyl hydrolase)
VDPALANTNGYDFRNDVMGDVYIFLLGATLDDWHHSRQEFLQLTGPTPQLPDFAFGTWFTYWHQVWLGCLGSFE